MKLTNPMQEKKTEGFEKFNYKPHARRKGYKPKCSKCGESGHYKQTCPYPIKS